MTALAVQPRPILTMTYIITGDTVNVLVGTGADLGQGQGGAGWGAMVAGNTNTPGDRT